MQEMLHIFGIMYFPRRREDDYVLDNYIKLSVMSSMRRSLLPSVKQTSPVDVFITITPLLPTAKKEYQRAIQARHFKNTSQL